MKIMHIALAGAFTEGMSYQVNRLSKQNEFDGHITVFVTECEKYENC